ncbi:MAG: DUF4230 domain-containing protein [Chloroflexi bacterium]|nr:DUF4230 domain-containing protein [Chloroflexota bacterium]
MSRNLTTIFVIGLLLIAAVTGYGIVQAVRSATRPAAELNGSLATQASNLFHPTPTIYPDSVTVVRAVRPLARLETVQYSVEKVITAEVGQGSFCALFGDKLIFVAHGQVIAGVDLSKIKDGDVKVTPDGTALVTLPPSEVFVATLDNQKSYIYNRETGLFTRGDVNLETQARQAAEDEIEKAAREDGILDQAQTNAEAYLRSLVLALRVKEVVFVRATP